MAGLCTGPGPCDAKSFGSGDNWVNRRGGLPPYVRAVAHAFQRGGMTESAAIARAIGVIRNWAQGKGNVTAATRARAAAALAQWEAMKGSKNLTAETAAAIDLASSGGHHIPGTPYDWRHGYVPLNAETAAKYHKHRLAARLPAQSVHHRSQAADGSLHRQVGARRAMPATNSPHPAPHTVKPGEHATISGSDHYGNRITLTGKVNTNDAQGVFRHGSTEGKPVRVIGISRQGSSGLTRTDHVIVPDPTRSTATRQTNAQALADARKASEAEHAKMTAARNNANVVARTRPTPSSADISEAAAEWKAAHPGQPIAGHEREISRIADEKWRAKRLTGPDTGNTSAQDAAERERVKASVASPQTTIDRLAAEKAGSPRITIEHTGDGTLVHGTERSDAPQLKAAGFKWSRNLNAWYLPRTWNYNTRGERVRRLQASLGSDAHVKASPEVHTSAAERDAAKAERGAARAERMDARAAKESAAATGRFATADRISGMIPMGQPILVGHHSEGRHRSDIRRIGSNMDKGLEHSRNADTAKRAADSARAELAGRQNPVAIGRRLATLRTEQRDVERMLNGSSQKMGFKPATGDHRTQLEARSRELADEIQLAETRLAGLQSSGQAAEHSSKTIKPGDHVKVRGTWRKVVRVNPKSVSTETGYSWTDKAPYHEITGHRRTS